MNLLLEKLYLEKREFVKSDLLRRYCKSLKLNYNPTIKNLLSLGYLVRIFRGIFYVRSLEDKKLGKFIDFYLLLRDISRAKYTKREEYRRHVTMISEIETGNFFEVSIDRLYEYHDTMKEFVEYLEKELK